MEAVSDRHSSTVLYCSYLKEGLAQTRETWSLVSAFVLTKVFLCPSKE